MKSEKLSIIIPVYNRSHLIGRCLDSVWGQSYRSLEVIVVDNNSSDGTVEAVEQWHREHPDDEEFTLTLLKEPRQGAAFARERGLEASTSDYVYFFDSDDYMSTSLAEVIMRTFAAEPDADIVAWRCRHNLLNGTSRLTHVPGKDEILTQLVHCQLSTQSFAVKHRFITEAGGWDTRLRVWDDWELGLRLLLKGARTVYLGFIGVEILMQEVSITGNEYYSKAAEWEKALDIIEEEVATCEGNEKRKGLWQRAINYRRAILAANYRREGHKEVAQALLKKAKQKQSPTQRLRITLAHLWAAQGLRAAHLFL